MVIHLEHVFFTNQGCFVFNFYCIFPSPFNPLLFPTRPNHYTVVCVHEPFSLFAQTLHSLTPQIAVILFSMYESASILLVSSNCQGGFLYHYQKGGPEIIYIYTRSIAGYISGLVPELY